MNLITLQPRRVQMRITVKLTPCSCQSAGSGENFRRISGSAVVQQLVHFSLWAPSSMSPADTPFALHFLLPDTAPISPSLLLLSPLSILTSACTYTVVFLKNLSFHVLVALGKLSPGHSSPSTCSRGPASTPTHLSLILRFPNPLLWESPLEYLA